MSSQLQPPETARCWLCYGPPQEIPRDEHGGVKFYMERDKLCQSHWDDNMAAVREYEATHPNGQCTDTCGCMTLDELKAKLGL
jgi:hypothetical protein